VLYDELGSGTDPEEGAALAAALLEELARQGCWVVATAHLVTVAARLENLPGAVNAAMGYDEEGRRPTYRLNLGIPGRSHGLAIAATCGVAATVIERARSLLSDAYLAIDAYLAALQEERDRLRQAQKALDDARSESASAQRAAEEERVRFVADRETLKQTLAAERERLRRRATEQLAAALEELHQARERGEIPGKKRQASLRRAALRLTEEDPTPSSAVPDLSAGARVRLHDARAPGVVSRVVGDRVEILIAGKRLWVERSACELVETPATDADARIVVSGGEDAAMELKLLGFTREDAREELTRFLDRAVLAGLPHVRIVHGHGTGTLRRLVRETLSGHPHVSAFAHPPQFRGGTGVTEVELQ
jgi:DNA mismatch repair protein MutS2